MVLSVELGRGSERERWVLEHLVGSGRHRSRPWPCRGTTPRGARGGRPGVGRWRGGGAKAPVSSQAARRTRRPPANFFAGPPPPRSVAGPCRSACEPSPAAGFDPSLSVPGRQGPGPHLVRGALEEPGPHGSSAPSQGVRDRDHRSARPVRAQGDRRPGRGTRQRGTRSPSSLRSDLPLSWSQAP